MPRTFNGTTDVIRTTLGAVVAFGPGTLAIVVRKASDSTTGKLPVCFGGLSDADSYYMWFDFNGSGSVGFWNGAADQSLTTFFSSTDGWALLAVTKATGTATPRFHRYIFKTGVWTHTNAAGTLANSPQPGNSRAAVGGQTNQAGDPGLYSPFPGDISLVGNWNVELSDTQIESLAASLKAWFAVQPKLLWLLDQDTTSQKLLDMTGSKADQSAISGTSIGTVSVPGPSYGGKL